MTTTFTEVLPKQKSSKRNAINFTPSPSDPGRGVLVIHSRESVAYRVAEFGTQFGGRAFRLTKIRLAKHTIGDPESTGYDVYCGRPHDMCECKGWLVHGTCKHLDACHALIDNGWMPTRAEAAAVFSDENTVALLAESAAIQGGPVTITREGDGALLQFRSGGGFLEARRLRDDGTAFDNTWSRVDAEGCNWLTRFAPGLIEKLLGIRTAA